MLPRSERCSDASEARHESIVGTASTVRSWLLIEFGGAWGRDALLGARMPGDLGPALFERCRAARVRPLLIRRVGRTREGDGGVTCFAIRSGPGPPWMEHLRLARVQDVLEVDVGAVGRGASSGSERRERPLFLVCTHGRRDVCCAERGRPVAQTLSRAFPEETWESSHVGGDRFAGNIVAFPHGLYLGRVKPEEAEDVARTYLDGRVPLAHLRGRSCHPMPVQAAEHALRTREGLEGVDDVELEGRFRDDGVQTVRFSTSRGRFDVTITVEDAEHAYLTCHSAREERAPSYRVTAIERVDHD